MSEKKVLEGRHYDYIFCTVLPHGQIHIQNDREFISLNLQQLEQILEIAHKGYISQYAEEEGN